MPGPSYPTLPLNTVREYDRPSYLGYSSPISQPQIDKSSAIEQENMAALDRMLAAQKQIEAANLRGQADILTQEGKGSAMTGDLFQSVGNIFASASKAGDVYAKTYIGDQVDKVIMPERELEIKRLQNAASFAGGGMDVLPEDAMAQAPAVPAELQELPATLESLEGARSGGKISRTMYYGRLSSLAKDLRTRFPAYRDYVDEKVKNILGVDPANAYISSLMGDINSFVAKGSADKDKLFTRLYSVADKAPELASTINRLRKDGNTKTAELDLTAAMKKIAERHVEDDYVKGLETAGKKNVLLTEPVVIKRLSEDAATSVKSIMTHFGMESTASQADLLNAIKTAGGTSSDRLSQVADMIFQERTRLFNWMRSEYSKDLGDGTSYVSRMGGWDKVEKHVKDSLKVHDSLIDFIRDDKIGIALAASRSSRFMTDDMLNTVYKTDPRILVINSLVKAGGTESMNTWLSAGLQAEIGKKPIEFEKLIRSANTLITQPTMPGTVAPDPKNPITGIPTTGNIILERARTAGADKVTLAKISEIPELLMDPSMDDVGKLGIIRGFLSEDNRDYLRNFTTDAKDDRGRDIPGRSWVFSKMTSEGMSNEVMRLAVKGRDPNIWAMYRNWAEGEFANHIMSKELNDLRGIQLHPDMNLRFDDKENRFVLSLGRDINVTYSKLTPEVYRTYVPTDVVAMEQARMTIARLNQGIPNLANIAKAEGRDPTHITAYLINTLVASGWNPAIAMEEGKDYGTLSDLIGKAFKTLIKVNTEKDP